MTTLPPSSFLHCAIVGHDQLYLANLRILGLDVEHPLPLRVIAKCLNRFHKGCPCGRTVSETAVWKADLPWQRDIDAMLEDFMPEEHSDKKQDPDAPVQSVYPDYSDYSPDAVNLMFGLEPHLPPVQQFDAVRRLEGNVCRVSGSCSSKTLPSIPEYSTFSACAGTYFIDKSDFIDLRYNFEHNWDPRVPVIRRGAGYGKTVFLSMLTSYFDSTNSSVKLPGCRTGHARVPRYSNVLVLRLDFEQLVQLLSPDRGAGHAEVMDACTAFMASVTEEFYTEHEPLLQRRRPAADDRFMHSYEGFKLLLSSLDYRLFVAIDNYTAPFLHVTGMSARYAEIELWTQIVGPILCDLDRFVWRGVIVGRPLGGQKPFSHIDIFAEKTEDLTDVHEHVEVIGLSRQDIVELGRAVYDEDFDLAEAMDIPASAAADDLKGRPVPPAPVYSAQNVVAVLSRLIRGELLADVLEDESPIASFPASTSADSQLSKTSTEPPATPADVSEGFSPTVASGAAGDDVYDDQDAEKAL